MHHFVSEMCTHGHISVTKWCMVGHQTGALWDLLNRPVAYHKLRNVYSNHRCRPIYKSDENISLSCPRQMLRQTDEWTDHTTISTRVWWHYNMANFQQNNYNRHPITCWSWWRHQMETFSALLAFCAGISLVTGEFPSQRPVTRSFDVFFDLCLNKQLSKQSWGWWVETPSCSLWCHCDVKVSYGVYEFNNIKPGYGLSLVDTLWNASSYPQPLEQEGNPMT